MKTAVILVKITVPIPVKVKGTVFNPFAVRVANQVMAGSEHSVDCDHRTGSFTMTAALKTDVHIGDSGLL